MYLEGFVICLNYGILFNRIGGFVLPSPAAHGKNKRAPAHTKAKESEFLLTTKLFCGKCERMMVGESGKSHTGTMPYYYKRGNAKRKDGCDEGQLERTGTNAPWSG